MLQTQSIFFYHYLVNQVKLKTAIYFSKKNLETWAFKDVLKLLSRPHQNIMKNQNGYGLIKTMSSPNVCSDPCYGMAQPEENNPDLLTTVVCLFVYFYYSTVLAM